MDLPLSGGVSDDVVLQQRSMYGVAGSTGYSLDRSSEWSMAAGTGRRARIVKRPSVDSGINLSHDDPYKRTSLESGLDGLQKPSRLVARVVRCYYL